MGCKSLLELSVFRVCLFARCLTLTGAGDKCSLWQPMELTDSRESHIVKVSISKPIRCSGNDIERSICYQRKYFFFLMRVYMLSYTKKDTHSSHPLCRLK